MAAKRREIGEVEACVPLVSDAGVEAEVDWGEAQVIMRGEPQKVHLFLMRACHSGATYVAAFEAETQQPFLEAHVAALEFFDGAFGLIRYDNLKAAVAQVMKGRRRVESDRFVALRSHYGFKSSFASPASRGPADLPAEPHCTTEEASPRVDSKAMVTIRQNRYSVPARLAGMRVRAQVGAREISIWHDGKVVATHERLAGRHEASAQLDHYLDLLTRKPGALARSLALRQERDRGDWPLCFDELWSERSRVALAPPRARALRAQSARVGHASG
ncbi:MAG TPA: hypothetical protein VFT19_01305 [Solirubrobacterales bacterium]|nr:hypothetical protein [Solirubrobacterales bacterium]